MAFKILTPAKTTTAFAKVGILGFQGSGKTYTAALIAAGILERIKNKRLAFYDTETGSDWLLKKFQALGIDVLHAKTRSFSDLLGVVKECESEKIPLLIADSITHVWRELMDAYDKKLNRNGRLQFQDWYIIKREWAQWTDAFVNSPIHIIVCGRAGFEYDYDFNPDGTKDLIKSGIKMKVESEFGFEPSLVIEMERTSEGTEELRAHLGKFDKANKIAKQQHEPQHGSKWIHRAHILKDRADKINGQHFDNPTFDSFLPHFECINLGGSHLGVDVSRTSEGRFDAAGKPDWRIEQDRRQVLIQEIDGTLALRFPGSTKEEKTAKLALLKWTLGTYSDTAIAQLPSEKLQAALESIRAILAEADHGEAAIKEIIQDLSAARPLKIMTDAQRRLCLAVEGSGKTLDDFLEYARGLGFLEASVKIESWLQVPDDIAEKGEKIDWQK